MINYSHASMRTELSVIIKPDVRVLNESKIHWDDNFLLYIFYIASFNNLSRNSQFYIIITSFSQVKLME